MIKFISAVVFGPGWWDMNKHEAKGLWTREAGLAAWTYMELLLVDFIQTEPADCREAGGVGGVLLLVQVMLC